MSLLPDYTSITHTAMNLQETLLKFVGKFGATLGNVCVKFMK